jgi:hypothetical protein
MTYTDNNINLVWQPDTRVSAFPSGLVMVQRSAVCRKTENKRSEIAVGAVLLTTNTPEIDGLFIFPEAQERRDAGFSTYDVSAYGRTTDKFREVVSDIVVGAYSTTATDENDKIWKITVSVLGKKVIQQGVVFASAITPVTAPTPAATITTTFTSPYYPTGSIVQTAPSVWVLENSTRKNYGTFDEVINTWKTPTDQNVSG